MKTPGKYSSFSSIPWMLSALCALLIAVPVFGQSRGWETAWPNTDFSKATVDLSEIRSGGPPKDGIPAIVRTRFAMVAEVDDVASEEPVIELLVQGKARAYPLRILMWHEIANDVISGIPVVVTYCPLCNAAMVFDRRLDGEVLTFGVTGKLRHSDMIMYDRNTESWWQQFQGKGIVGTLAARELRRLPSRVLPFSEFRNLHPNGKVLLAPSGSERRYGNNPYVNYDSSRWPRLFESSYEGPVPPMAYVIAVGQDAWPLQEIRELVELRHGDIRISWTAGMNSALDRSQISKGRDLGFVSVERRGKRGEYEAVAHEMTFAFAFKAFNPDGIIHQSSSP